MSICVAALVLLFGIDPKPSDESTEHAAARAALLKHKARTGRLACLLQPNHFEADELAAEKEPFRYVVIGVDWTGGKEHLRHLRALPELRGLLFTHPDVDDEWCKILEHLPQLTAVYISKDKITDKGIVALAKMPNLRNLSLNHSSVTDEGLRNLRDLKELRWLALAACPNITDAGLVHLKGLTNLEDVTLECTRTTVRGACIRESRPPSWSAP